MSSHYFIGIKIPDLIASSIIEQREENTALRKSHKTLPFKEDLHITLSFLGAVEADVLDALFQSLQEIDWNSFRLTTDGLAYFGSAKTPRVVFVGVKKNEELAKLQMQVAKTASRFLKIDHTRDYNPHITIAKKWASKADLDIEKFSIEEMSFEVEHFSIFKINPTSIPRYEEVHSLVTRRK